MGQLLLVDVQSTLTSLATHVTTWNGFFCSPLVSFLQFQGASVLILMGLGWCLAGLARQQELRRRTRRYSTTKASGDGYNRPPQEEWPGITMILPVKGCRKQSLRNWQVQLAQEYEGKLEVIFVVDSKDDPAREATAALASRSKRKNARVILSSPSRHSSQKIHNIQTGIQAACKDHKYIVSVDDDVSLHPGSLRETIAALEAAPDMFMATGYPFDIPDLHSNVLSYCVLSYHLPLLIAFSLQQRTQFVWGGFMMFRLEDMLTDKYGIMKAWSSGGYSDDLIVAAKCGEHGLKILCPSFTVFPQWLDGDYDWKRYWNYLRRQVFVMDTYRSPLNKRINHAMMLIHSYLSLAFVAPCITVGLRLVLWVLAAILLPTQKVYEGPGTSLHWVGNFGASLCPWSSISLLAFLAALLASAAALWWMTGVLLELFHRLSPQSESIDPGTFHWGRLWLGFFLNNCLIPPCMLYTRFTSRVVWSGVEYTKRNGQVIGASRSSQTSSPWQKPRQSVDLQLA